MSTQGHRDDQLPTDDRRKHHNYSFNLPLRESVNDRNMADGSMAISSSIPIHSDRHDKAPADGPLSPVHVRNNVPLPEPSSAQIETVSPDIDGMLNATDNKETSRLPRQPRLVSASSEGGSSPAAFNEQRSASPQIITSDYYTRPGDDNRSREEIVVAAQDDDHVRSVETQSGLQYHHQRQNSTKSAEYSGEDRASPQYMHGNPNTRRYLNPQDSRPTSSYSSTLDVGLRGRDGQNNHARTPSSQGRKSPDTRPMSYIDLLSLPYSQQAPPNINFGNSHLKNAVGSNASLLSTKKTLEMYRANVKKTNDPAVQYSFAIFMLDAAQDLPQPSASASEQGATSRAELVSEARQILLRMADRSYPFAQYYLADGYASGVFNKGKEDNDKAFPLFVAASKHGHAEAGYRAALCYEFGWGTRKDPLKAVQFYRQSASKNHPGAMVRLGRACLTGDLGIGNRYREGVKWLKRAAESADFQYNTAPYELGVLHETGYGDDIFRDETYAAQLYTQSADLGHAEASFRLGDAYEHGKLNCPKDPALSVHFYNGAASRGHPQAMMALCAWYMVGAEPVLEKDENEAYEWAKRAAECGLPKAEYAVGYFTEMGIGCRRDPLEANVWYVKAADQGDERAKHRIAAIRAAASGRTPTQDTPSSLSKKGQSSPEDKEKKPKRWGVF